MVLLRYQHLFTQQERVDLVRAQFLRASAETNVLNIAYCFMSDHLHHLVKGDTPDADAKAFIRKAKQYSGFYFKDEFGMRLWSRKGQPGASAGPGPSSSSSVHHRESGEGRFSNVRR
jgi:REP element-mobilizing transposase RayT